MGEPLVSSLQTYQVNLRDLAERMKTKEIPNEIPEEIAKELPKELQMVPKTTGKTTPATTTERYPHPSSFDLPSKFLNPTATDQNDSKKGILEMLRDQMMAKEEQTNEQTTQQATQQPTQQTTQQVKKRLECPVIDTSNDTSQEKKEVQDAIAELQLGSSKEKIKSLLLKKDQLQGMMLVLHKKKLAHIARSATLFCHWYNVQHMQPSDAAIMEKFEVTNKNLQHELHKYDEELETLKTKKHQLRSSFDKILVSPSLEKLLLKLDVLYDKELE